MKYDELFDRWIKADMVTAFTGEEKRMCIAAMTFARATGRAEGLREAVEILSVHPWNAVGAGDNMINQQDAIESILAAIDQRKETTE